MSGTSGGWWWAAYLIFGAAYLWCVVVAPTESFPTREAIIALGVVAPLGVAVVVLSGSHGFTAIALVMTAILVGQLLPLRIALAAIVAQTLVVVALLWVRISADGFGYAISTGVAFFVFQLFALLMAGRVDEGDRGCSERRPIGPARTPRPPTRRCGRPRPSSPRRAGRRSGAAHRP